MLSLYRTSHGKKENCHEFTAKYRQITARYRQAFSIWNKILKLELWIIKTGIRPEVYSPSRNKTKRGQIPDRFEATSERLRGFPKKVPPFLEQSSKKLLFLPHFAAKARKSPQFAADIGRSTKLTFLPFTFVALKYFFAFSCYLNDE
ncbi:hypothetical protein [Desertivirga arenae]|uniref:hypothetical protein n=1 Tax=Desertivirga arenae TaxID=2810309 RepID=UPI001A95BEFC|nr:hypothetical protein [Pedobacter sp. SYSU D00823]